MEKPSKTKEVILSTEMITKIRKDTSI